MNLKILSAITLAFSFIAFQAHAAEPLLYGEGVVEQGSVSVARDGKMLNFMQSTEQISVYLNDVVSVGEKSRFVITNQNKDRLVLGSNAAFQVKPWEDKSRTGVFRMLYGKLFVRAQKASGGRQAFSLKTSAATIGVKGTEFSISVTPQGDAVLVVQESVVEMAGQDGMATEIRPDLVSVVVNGQSSTSAAVATEELNSELSEYHLDAPSVTSEDALELPGEESLLSAGVITETDLEDARRTLVNVRDTIQVQDAFEALSLEYDFPEGNLEKQVDPVIILPGIG